MRRGSIFAVRRGLRGGRAKSFIDLSVIRLMNDKVGLLIKVKKKE